MRRLMFTMFAAVAGFYFASAQQSELGIKVNNNYSKAAELKVIMDRSLYS
jgi:hypothetical protein